MVLENNTILWDCFSHTLLWHHINYMCNVLVYFYIIHWLTNSSRNPTWLRYTQKVFILFSFFFTEITILFFYSVTVTDHNRSQIYHKSILWKKYIMLALTTWWNLKMSFKQSCGIACDFIFNITLYKVYKINKMSTQSNTHSGVAVVKAKKQTLFRDNSNSQYCTVAREYVSSLAGA